MFDGINDSDADAARLVALLAGVTARLNLIPFNPISQSELRSAPAARIQAFRAIAMAGGLRCMVRWPKGQDIAAACGQLAARA